jgi:hypothetical protein
MTAGMISQTPSANAIFFVGWKKKILKSPEAA